MAEVYGSFEFAQKSYTRGSDIGKGTVGVPNINAPFFLELKTIKTHTHGGVDSQKLQASATPQMVKGYRTNEREERGTATWTGVAAASGSIVLTYGTAFLAAPNVFVTGADGDIDLQFSVGSITSTGCTIYWKDDTAANHTEVNIQYLIKGV